MSKQEEKNYKFGIIKRRPTGYGLRGICNCGQHIIRNQNNSSKFQCDNCGNDFFVDARGQHNQRFVIPYLEAERKDNRGFKVKRVNLSVIFDGESVVAVKENLKRTMEYDMVDKVLKVWRNDQLEYDSTVNSVGGHVMESANRMFFTQLDEDLFLDFVSNDVTRGIYEVVKKLSVVGWNKKDKILKGLSVFMEDYQYLQILANAGIPNIDRFYIGRGYYGRMDSKTINTAKTKPHEILGVPKFMIDYIRQDTSIDTYVLREFQGHFKKIDNNKFREILAIVKDESTMRELANSVESLMTIHIDYEYTNLKQLVLYLFRTVRLTQGITSPQNACTYLKDYIRMSRALGLEYEKYPKSLKKEHDVVQMNYKVINDSEQNNKMFAMSVDKKSYKNLEFAPKKQKFAILLPKTSEDIIKEGNELSHCVASYVKDVINDRCKIIFLRDKENLDKPLATIEVRGMNIRQAKGYGNRSMSAEQKEFIKLWAEEKDLVEAYY